MAEINLDVMLQDALIAAMEEDWTPIFAGENTITMSHRQRRRFRKMRANPRGYYRSYTHAGKLEEADATSISIASLSRHKKQLRHLLAAVIAAAVLIGSALAYSLSGGQIFTNLFHSIASHLGLNPAYMNTEQLPELSGGSIGDVIETEEFRFEIMDIVTDGYSAMISVRVTDLQSDTVERDGSVPDFGIMQSPLMDEYGCNMGHSRSGSSDLGELEENQFFCTFVFTGDQLIPAGWQQEQP